MEGPEGERPPEVESEANKAKRGNRVSFIVPPPPECFNHLAAGNVTLFIREGTLTYPSPGRPANELAVPTKLEAAGSEAQASSRTASYGGLTRAGPLTWPP